MIQRRTVGIVGTGNVGTAAAYALFNHRLASEIILVDKNERQAEGEAMDLMHGQLLVGRVKVRAGGYDDLSEAQVIVISAGAGQSSPEETRLDLLQRNADIFRQIIAQLDKYAPRAILLVATNPVDVLTYVSQELSERPPERIIGTGTLLDTARFRALLGRHYGVDPRSVHAYILGEHGDSEVPIWSTATIGGLSIAETAIMGHTFEEDVMDDLFVQARDAAYHIIERKGHTDSAIGVVIMRIVRAILSDEQSVLPVSTRPGGAYDLPAEVCLSLPCVVGQRGIEGRITPQLAPDELEALRHSAQTLLDSREGLQLE